MMAFRPVGAALLLAVFALAAQAGNQTRQCPAEFDESSRLASELWLEQVREDVRLRTDADSRAVLAVLERLAIIGKSAGQVEEGVASEAPESAVERQVDPALKAFQRLWRQRDSAPWSLLVPLYWTHRTQLDADSEVRWRNYLIERGGPGFRAQAIRLTHLHEAGATEEELDAALEAAARQGEPDPEYAFEATRHIARAMLRVGVPHSVRAAALGCFEGEPPGSLPVSEQVAAVTGAFGIHMAFVDRGILYPHCSRDAEPLSRARRDACRTIARKMAQQGSNIHERSLGSAFWLRLADDPAEYQQALSDRRTLLWQREVHFYALVSHDGPESEQATMERWAGYVMQPGSGEIDFMQHTLQEQGEAPTPPEAWMPINPALLQP